MTDILITDKPLTPAPEENPPSIFEMVENVTKAAALVLAVSYGLGLIISNQYLAPLGISDFSSLKPKYVLTGLWTLLMIATASLPVTLRLGAGSNSLAQKKPVVAFFGGLGFSVVGILALLSVVLRFDMTHVREGAVLYTLFSVLAASMNAAYFINRLRRDLRKPDRSILFDSFMLILSLCFVLVPMTQNIASNIYDYVPDAMGGGEPISACVMLKSEKGAQFWKQAGVTLEDWDSPLHLFDDRTRIVLIVYQDEKIMVVEGRDRNAPKKAAEGRTIVISKDLVEGYMVVRPGKNVCGSFPAAKPSPPPAPAPSRSCRLRHWRRLILQKVQARAREVSLGCCLVKLALC